MKNDLLQKWSVWRNRSLDVNGYESMGSWSATRKNVNDIIGMTLHATIAGKIRDGRVRPNRVYVALEFMSFRKTIEHVSCNSIANALRKADKLDINEDIDNMLKSYYSKSNGSSIFKCSENNGAPFMTCFGYFGDTFRRAAPKCGIKSGNYLSTNNEYRTFFNINEWGYSGRTEPTDIAKILNSWL